MGIDPGVAVWTVHLSAVVSQATARTLRIDRIGIRNPSARSPRSRAAGTNDEKSRAYSFGPDVSRRNWNRTPSLYPGQHPGGSSGIDGPWRRARDLPRCASIDLCLPSLRPRNSTTSSRPGVLSCPASARVRPISSEVSANQAPVLVPRGRFELATSRSADFNSRSGRPSGSSSSPIRAQLAHGRTLARSRIRTVPLAASAPGPRPPGALPILRRERSARCGACGRGRSGCR